MLSPDAWERLAAVSTLIDELRHRRFLAVRLGRTERAGELDGEIAALEAERDGIVAAIAGRITAPG